ncbi:TorF family putative porin [Novosphingobium sp.]|uniref:TorF family putative porin n=1 Tax=Novosphingobium sp. TaxID=1874826 RepID=UPI0038B6FD90
MKKSFAPSALRFATVAAAFLYLPVAVHAEEATEAPKAVTVSGTVGLVSDYRFRGVSQSDRSVAIQGGFTVSHQSGLYGSVWASNLSGWGTFGGSNTELDLVGGFKREIGAGVAVDVGLTWYMYPAGAAKTDFGEPYVKVSSTVGPASVLVGVAYAPKQQALGKWYNSGASYATGTPDKPFAKEDNLYLWGDVSGGVPNTPVTLKAHLGYSKGNSGLGPNGTSVAPTGKYFDWMLGTDFALGPVTLGIAYVDTDISEKKAQYLQPNFGRVRDGASISKATVVFSLSASF